MFLFPLIIFLIFRFSNYLCIIHVWYFDIETKPLVIHVISFRTLKLTNLVNNALFYILIMDFLKDRNNHKNAFIIKNDTRKKGQPRNLNKILTINKTKNKKKTLNHLCLFNIYLNY